MDNRTRDARYAKNAGAVFSLKDHLLWCPQYRHPILTDQVESQLRQLLAAKAAELDITIRAREIMPDHVHWFVASDPTRGVAEIVNRFQGVPSRVLRQEFAHRRSRLPTLWSRRYFAGTVGLSAKPPSSATSPIRRERKCAEPSHTACWTNANQERELLAALESQGFTTSVLTTDS